LKDNDSNAVQVHVVLYGYKQGSRYFSGKVIGFQSIAIMLKLLSDTDQKQNICLKICNMTIKIKQGFSFPTKTD